MDQVGQYVVPYSPHRIMHNVLLQPADSPSTVERLSRSDARFSTSTERMNSSMELTDPLRHASASIPIFLILHPVSVH